VKSILFSGQRSQHLGMMSSFEKETTVRHTFDRASFILDRDLWSLCSDQSIHRTDVAQPVLLAAGVAIYRSLGCPAGIMAGHSLGEFIALTCAGAIDFEDALHLVDYRGKLMNELGQPGCMAMIYGLSYDTIKELSIDKVDIAAVNSPVRISISGIESDVRGIVDQAIKLGAEWTDVWNETLPFHSRLMNPIVKDFKDAVDSIHIEVPTWSSVVSNVTGEIYTTVNQIKDNLVLHLTNTVQWSKCLSTIKKQGIYNYIEIGARPLLEKLVLENQPNATVIGVHDHDSMDKYYNNEI
jgi:[acyl-carrier-protein] S-malonyltransferase